MRKFLAVAACLVTSSVFAQFSTIQYKDFVRLNDTRYGIPIEKVYVIAGKDIHGSPFLYEDWLRGTITTQDGRQFNDYLVRYDAYDQRIFFKNGPDSFEVDEPIREFTLTSVQDDTTLTFRFILPPVPEKKNARKFYELLYEDRHGILLKLNQKYISTNSDNLPHMGQKKYFNLDLKYVYFDKSTKKMNPLQIDGSDLASVLGADQSTIQELRESLNLNREEDKVKALRHINKKKS